MGSIDIIKPLSTVQTNAVNKSQQYQEFSVTPRIDPGATGYEAK